MFGGACRRQAALDQGLRARRFRTGRRSELAQPGIEALAHFAGRLAREGDREDLVRRGAIEQGAQDARDQHPGLARTSAGLDDDAARRVAGERIEHLARDRFAIRAISRDAVHGEGADQ